MNWTLIVAMAQNGTIGRDGDLPWRLPADLAHFKRETTGKTILMGRVTWDSLGRPLPKRRNVVLSSRQLDLPRAWRHVKALSKPPAHRRR